MCARSCLSISAHALSLSVPSHRDDQLFPAVALCVQIFVHQRSVHRTGFRSLHEGEPVEFDVTVTAEGKLEAVRVTGPGGAEVLGITGSRKTKQAEEEDSADEQEAASSSAGGPVHKRQEKPPRPKPYTAFVPRTVKRPAPAAVRWHCAACAS